MSFFVLGLMLALVVYMRCTDTRKSAQKAYDADMRRLAKQQNAGPYWGEWALIAFLGFIVLIIIGSFA